MLQVDWLLTNATLLTKEGQEKKAQIVAIVNGKILSISSNDSGQYKASQTLDCQHQLITPGLIDCHTHLVFAGDRAKEFEQRLQGIDYQTIARTGGGIWSTVKKTREASFDELLEQSLPRILALKQEGVTTVEIKSGYGLDLATELKILSVARRLGALSGLRVVTTFLGAHCVPREYENQADAYVDYLIAEMLPRVAESRLADAVDVFCESIGFSLSQTERIFAKAGELNLPIKCHAEQLSNMGASRLASKMGALSCDHLEYIDEAGLKALSASGTVAVLLPGAYYFLKETQKPPIETMRKYNINMAVATDCNPGTSPTTSLLLMLNMACQLFGLTPAEALLGVTVNAAKALGLHQEIGALEEGRVADLVLWGLSDSASLCYHFGYPLPHQTMIAGLWQV